MANMGRRKTNSTGGQAKPGKGEIVLYLAEIPDPAVLESMDLSCLSKQEYQRANRLVRGEKQRSFLFSRLFLRRLLGQMLSVAPSTLEFGLGEHGKPFLSGRHHSAGLHFNLSHSGNQVLAGFGDTPLGVDIERVRDNLDYQRFARRFFSRVEQEELQSCSTSDQCRAFFDGWTRKEAFLKAKGCGLTLGLDQFDVSLSPDYGQTLLATRYDTRDRYRWQLQALDVGKGYQAAVAWKGVDREIRLNKFQVGTKKGAEAPFL